MPLHFYAPDHAFRANYVAMGFEQHAAAGEAPPNILRPKCGQAVQRQGMQSISTPKLSAGVSVSTAKQAGFAVLKRTSDGHFEKR